MGKPSKTSVQQHKPIFEELEERRLFSGGIEGLVDLEQDNGTQATYLDLENKHAQAA